MRSITEEFGSLFAADDDTPPQEEQKTVALKIMGQAGGATALLEEALAKANPDTPLPDDALTLAHEIASFLDHNDTPIIDVSLNDEDPNDARIYINLRVQDEGDELFYIILAVTIYLPDPKAYIVGCATFGDTIDECTAMCVANKINEEYFGVIFAYAEDSQGWKINFASEDNKLDETDLAVKLLDEADLIIESFNGLFTL